MDSADRAAEKIEGGDFHAGESEAKGYDLLNRLKLLAIIGLALNPLAAAASFVQNAISMPKKGRPEIFQWALCIVLYALFFWELNSLYFAALAFRLMGIDRLIINEQHLRKQQIMSLYSGALLENLPLLYV